MIFLSNLVVGLKCRDTFAGMLLKIMKLCSVADFGDLVPENCSFGVGTCAFSIYIHFKQWCFFFSVHSVTLVVCCVYTPTYLNFKGAAACIRPSMTPDSAMSILAIPTGSPSRGGDVAVYVFDVNHPSLPTPFNLFWCLLLSLGPLQLYSIP